MATPSSGEISIQDIVDEFGGTAPHSLSEYYGVGDVPASGELKMSDFYGQSNIIPAPVGLIVPYTSGTAPTGWTRFTSADDRFIVGAGSTYSSGSTGGATTFSVSDSTTTNGSHLASPETIAGSGANYATGYVSAAGSHSHSFSGSVTAQDVYKNFTLIKCTSSSVQIPQNAMLLAATSLSGLTNVETSTDRFLRSASTYGGTGGSSSISGSLTTGSAGSHTHASGNGNFNQYQPARNSLTAGSHTHSISFSGSLNTKRKYLSAWTNASANYDLVANGIAMWESATPPSGWYICNGANGTPDLRDYFIRIGTTGNHGTASGNNSVSWTASTSGGASHTHFPGSLNNTNTGGYHGSFAWSHSHTASGSATVLPPYYGLYFIMYAG